VQVVPKYETSIETAWISKCLKLEHEKPLSNFAYNLNLRRYIGGLCFALDRLGLYRTRKAKQLRFEAGADTRPLLSSTLAVPCHRNCMKHPNVSLKSAHDELRSGRV